MQTMYPHVFLSIIMNVDHDIHIFCDIYAARVEHGRIYVGYRNGIESRDFK